MNLQDFEHFTLAPGETLILRARNPMSEQQIMHMQESLRNVKFPLVVIPGPDFDMFAGMLTSPAAVMDNDEEAEAALFDHVHAAYHEGMTVQYKRKQDGDNMWCDAQRAYLMHHFDREKYDYRLAPPRK